MHLTLAGTGTGAHGVPDPLTTRFPVVALIASAGGVEALGLILGGLAIDLPAAVLVLLHQDPRGGDHLTAVLARHTALPTAQARDNQNLEISTVVTIPNGQHLLVTSETTIGLVDVGTPPPPRPSADLLLATLAVTCRARALAVVLTGMGHDGETGVKVITHCGGTVMAQEPSTAQHPGMPRAAVATDQVHRIVALNALAAAITRHVHSA